MNGFPKSRAGDSWGEAVIEGRQIVVDMLKGHNVESLINIGSQARSYMNGCIEAMKDSPDGAVVVPIAVMRIYSSFAAMLIIEELARREAEFNRAAAQ
jgi:hypothetical protein